MTEEEVAKVNDTLNSIGIENVQNILLIKNGATIKDILKVIFPKIIWGKENPEGKCIFGYKNKEDVDRKPANIGVELDLWNAKYKAEPKAIVTDDDGDLILKPCPLCGGKAKIVTRSVEVADVDFNHTDMEMYDWCKVVCQECGCSTTRARNPFSAKLLWNIRVK